MNIFGLLVIFIVIILLEVPRLLKQKMWRELAAFSFFLACGMILALLGVFNVEFPGPTAFVEVFFAPFADAYFSLLE